MFSKTETCLKKFSSKTTPLRLLFSWRESKVWHSSGIDLKSKMLLRSKWNIGSYWVRKAFFSTRKLSEIETSLSSRVTPLWQMPYDEQINFKIAKANKIISKVNPTLKLNRFLTPKRRTHYRNKAEYTIGYDQEARPCVGFVGGKAKKKEYFVVDPSHTIHITESSIKIRRAFQNVLDKLTLEWKNDSNPLIYHKRKHVGILRQLMVRTFESGQSKNIRNQKKKTR